MTTEVHLVLSRHETPDERVFLATLNLDEARRHATQPWDLNPKATAYRPLDERAGDIDLIILTTPIEDHELAELLVAEVNRNPNALTARQALTRAEDAQSAAIDRRALEAELLASRIAELGDEDA